MRYKSNLVVCAVFSVLSMGLSRQAFTQTSTQLPQWERGYLDIHQIATGRGNAALWILPDGTTMIVDAGDLGDTSKIKQEVMALLPNNSRTPAAWIEHYANHFLEPLGTKGKVDYVFLTHHHNDHNGAYDELSTRMRSSFLIDRGWPDYDYPSKAAVARSRPDFDGYLDAVRKVAASGTAVSAFKAGAEQFTLLHEVDAFPGFSIRNISASGKIWTGESDGARDMFPSIDALEERQYPNENMISATVLVRYGKFKYFGGADITGVIPDGAPAWRDVETPVGKLIGPVDATLMNHHGYSDTHNERFLATMRPRVFINAVWDYYHPQPEVLARILDPSIYTGDRLLFATGMVPGNVQRLGPVADQIRSGHIVLRVYPGGDEYQVFVLDARSQEYPLIWQSPRLKAGR